MAIEGKLYPLANSIVGFIHLCKLNDKIFFNANHFVLFYYYFLNKYWISLPNPTK